MQTPRLFSGSTSQSSSGASSPRRGRARMPVVIMSSQIPRLSDNRKHPYSQLSQSPASPSLLAKDARSGISSTRFGNRYRLAPSDRPLLSPVIQPQADHFSTDEIPSPLLLPPQRSSTVETLQPLGQQQVNRPYARVQQQETNIDLSGLNNKLGFHIPARETITPRGSDDESEDLLSFSGRRGRRSGDRGGNRTSRSLCIAEKALARSRQEEAPTRTPLRNAVSAIPAPRNTGVLSPSERRGRSREVKPCSRSPKSLSRLIIPSATVQEYNQDTDGMTGEGDLGLAETTVEEILSNYSPPRSTALDHSNNRVRGQTYPSVTSVSASPSASTPSTLRPARKSSADSLQSPRAPIPPRRLALATAGEANEEQLGTVRTSGATKNRNNNALTATSPGPILARPKPMRALSEKSCPTVMKHTTNVLAPASPISTIIELADLDSLAVSSASGLQMPRRTASISLKRIQDQDLETIMGSSTIRMPSPITSRFPMLNGDSDSLQYEEGGPAEDDPVKTSRHSPDHGPFHWLREVVPKGKEAMPKARRLLKLANPRSPRPIRAASHHFGTGPSDSDGLDTEYNSFSRAVLKRSRTASTATEGGDQKRHYTRWDGVKTRITEEDHPFHWAVLQRRHEIRKQGSRQSLRHGLLDEAQSPISVHKNAKYQAVSPEISRVASPTSRGPTTPSRVVSLSSLAHQAVASLTRPISHRHNSAPLRVPTSKSTGNIGGDPLGDEFRSSISYEVLPYTKSLASLAASFDSKVAYKACKKEEGYVDFDKVLGLDNHDAVHEEVVGLVTD